MSLTVVGRHIEISDTFRSQCIDKIEAALTKYFDRNFSGQATLSKEGHEFNAECIIHLDSGIELISSGRASDAYVALDQAIEHLEKRLRRYKRRLKNHKKTTGKYYNETSQNATSYVLQSPDDSSVNDDEEYTPVIIAEKATSLPILSVSDAVSEMDLQGVAVLVFRQPKDNHMHVIYRRSDGNIGWINSSA